MSEFKKPDFNPNATIQLTLEEIQLELEERLAPERPVESVRKTPPPLPAGAMPPLSVPPRVRPSESLPAARMPSMSVGKKIAYAAMFIALVAASIAAGIRVGGGARWKVETAPTASSEVAKRPPAPQPSERVLTVPVTEIK
jgi:hypothetical protein